MIGREGLEQADLAQGFASISAFLATGGGVADGQEVRVYSAQSGELVAVGMAGGSPAAVLRAQRAILGHHLADGEGLDENLGGTGPATTSLTYGANYVQINVTGTNADDEATFDLDVFGPGGSGEEWLSYVAAQIQIDPGGDDSLADGAMISVEMVNPSNARWVGSALVYVLGSTRWDRYLPYDIGGGEVLGAAKATSQDVSGPGCLMVSLQGRVASSQNMYGSWEPTANTADTTESGVAALALSADATDADQIPYGRIRIRPKVGDLTIRIYGVSARTRPSAYDPSA